ncbi:MAG: hypothetical protein WDO74_36580 [Pseudomonadota bacterium]
MFCVRRASYVTVCLAVASVACSTEEPAASPERLNGVSDDSLICKAVSDRFVGIPGLEDGTTATQDQALRGSWWIRGCSAKRVANGIRVRFEGPGWYFLDRRDGDFALRQQVTFTLGIELEGAPELSVDNGVATLRFDTKTTPEAELQVTRDLNVHATSAWGSLVKLLPAVSVRERAARRLSDLAVSALCTKLREGASATFELASRQGDVTLGKLAAGQTPQTAFTDGIPWLVNERVFLPPNATQVVGPIDPGPARLDARIEQGNGLAYRTVCQGDMPADYEAIASGHLDRLAPRTSAAHGTLAGGGEQSAILRVDGCKFFVVVSTLGESTTVAAVRVRG